MTYKFKSNEVSMLYNCGYSIKFWIYENHKEYLVKVDTLLKESEKEYSASQLARAFGLDSVVYEKIEVVLDNDLYSAVKSESYLRSGDEEFNLYDILGDVPKTGLNSLGRFDFLVNNILNKININESYLREKLLEMATFDYIICNVDRHLSNIILLKNGNEYRFSPLFDFGRSFLAYDRFTDESKISERLRESYLTNKSAIRDIQDIDLGYSKELVNKWLEHCGGLDGIEKLDINLGHKLVIEYRINQLLSL